MLTSGQKEQHHQKGYVIVDSLLTEEECEALNQRARDIVEERVPLGEGIQIHLEPEAEDRGLVSQENKYEYLFKIGYRLHETDPVFRRFVSHPQIVAALKELVGPDVKCIQTMYIDKSPHLGIGQPFHQDSNYLQTDPDTLLGLWLALDDVDIANGCLHVIPGSQSETIHPHESPIDPAQRAYHYHEVHSARERPETAVPLRRGSGVFFRGRVLHRSGNNSSDRRRRAFIAHYGSARSRWLNDPAARNPFLLVCGREYEGCL